MPSGLHRRSPPLTTPPTQALGGCLSGVPERVLFTGPPPGPSALAAWLLPSDQEWEDNDSSSLCVSHCVCAGWGDEMGAATAPWGCVLA